MKYYLKKCMHQELGSIVGDTKPQRGRYLLTSMNESVLSMFPPLSKSQLNDSALLPIIPLYIGKKIYCNYVYHNDKYHNSTAKHPRNEYRIYLNKSLENDCCLFTTDDIIIIRADNYKNDEQGNPQTVYYLDYIKNNGSDLYRMLDKAISDYPINGGYGVYDGTIQEFENKVTSISNPDDCSVEIDESVTKLVSKVDDSVASLFNATSFRDFVITGYDHLCAITGTVIRYESFLNLEAAHIRPNSHGGTFLPNNGMALCRDLHWAFDKGFFTLDDNLKIVVHQAVDSEYINSFNKKKIRIPQNPFFIPDLKNVKYHRDNVFGLFLRTGRL